MSNQGLEEIARGEQLMELVAEIKPLHDAVLAQYPSLSAAQEAVSDAYASYWSAFSAYQNQRFKLIKAKKREETQAAVSDLIDSVLAMAQSDSPDWDALLATFDPASSAASSLAGSSALASDSSATLAQRHKCKTGLKEEEEHVSVYIYRVFGHELRDAEREAEEVEAILVCARWRARVCQCHRARPSPKCQAFARRSVRNQARRPNGLRARVRHRLWLSLGSPARVRRYCVL